MFDFDAGKLIVFGIVALAVIPPKDLPRVMRTVGKYVGQMRRMASEFQGQFMEAMKEADLESVKQEIQQIHQAANIETSFEPASLMRDQLAGAVEERPAPSVAGTDEAQPPPSVYESVTVEAPAPAETPPHAEKAAS